MTLITPPTPPKRVTPDDLLQLENAGLFELVDGRIVEKTMSSLSGETAVIITSLLYPYVQARNLGKLYSETSFRCFPDDPDQVRRPDIAFMSAARLAGVPAEGHVPIRPDLAIEVVSPNDSVYELDHKLSDYRAAGIPLVWVFNPQARTVRVFHPGKSFEELGETDELRGNAVLPGFSTPVGELFPQKLPVG